MKLGPQGTVRLLMALALAGCSSGGGADGTPGPVVPGPDADGGVGNAGRRGGAGGAGGSSTAGAGGSPTAGAGGTSGSGAGGNVGDAGPEDGGPDGGEACGFMGTPVDPSSLPSCESDTCQDAHCLPRSVVTREQSELLADCDEDNECVPDLLIRTLGLVLLQSCESLGGAEGRCVSTCVPQVEMQIDALPQDVCEDSERCAPCYDPITGGDTGACSQGCDEGPTEEPYAFDECCGGVSVCVPEALVPEDQRGMLDATGCADSGELCAPKTMASDRSFVPESCESLGGAEGRCLPSCLPDVARQADRLPKDTCDTGELCAPCFDPITGDETGACGIADDEPEDDPFVFAECCGGKASCVPEALVPEDQRDLLDSGSCTGTEVLCAPKDIAAGSYEPDTCTSWGGAEGRCLLACLPDVAARASQLSRADCGDEELCVPCYDPLTGEDTGACTLEGDEPDDPAYEFPTCCDDGAGDDLGTCVPSALVPEAQLSLLDADTCTGEGFLCAPTDVANDAYAPIDCNSWLGAEGRCLPQCLPDVEAQAASLQAPASDTCAQGKLCVPCYSPVDGSSTGACTLEPDAPTEVARVFPTCCPTNSVNRGTCVPARAAGADAASLPNLNCETLTNDGDDYVCAPTVKVVDQAYEFPTACTTNCGADGVTCGLVALVAPTTFGNAGRCMPSCFLREQATPIGDNAENLFGRGVSNVCPTGEDCAPCIDPQTSTPTGVCP